ncbi:hypothetical protein BC937DRAFT_91784 [Endogone sp. FLAS-F59071]|nr:hypothetical protein BC937DRAFT_91784 [Endogone sp. FLAS-F59071]|eukprot:RUS15935.1 hypothetical protein BC937DRAFT_91784 [Endogone sp. FLAS-F59071]
MLIFLFLLLLLRPGSSANGLTGTGRELGPQSFPIISSSIRCGYIIKLLLIFQKADLGASLQFRRFALGSFIQKDAQTEIT